MKSLREQVKLAKEKNAANRCLKERCSKLLAEKDEVTADLEKANAQLKNKEKFIKELENNASENPKSSDIKALGKYVFIYYFLK